MLNFTGLLTAPEVERPPVFVATYSSGFGLVRREIEAPRQQSSQALEEKVDVKLTRALFSIYANADIAARFVLEELHQMARPPA